MALTLSLQLKGDIITSADPTLTLVDGLATTTLTHAAIAEFMRCESSFPLSSNIIWPLSCKPTGERWSFVYRRFGRALGEMSEEALDGWVTEDFIRQFSQLYCQLNDLKPVVSFSNVFVMEKQPLKLLLTSCCQNSQEYLEAYHSFLKRVGRNRKELIKRVKDSKDIASIKEVFAPSKQGKPLSKILQLKFSLKLEPYKINLEEGELQWVYSCFGLTHPKCELIYSGTQHNFDPLPLLKAVSKQHVFYLIQNTRGSKVAFYPAVRYEWSSTALFGGYLPDKQRKALLLGVGRRSVHALEDEGCAVGYGGEVLLAVGKVDLVFSAYNAHNVSYFPMSYRSDEKAAVTTPGDLLGSQFTLRQFEAYKIL